MNSKRSLQLTGLVLGLGGSCLALDASAQPRGHFGVAPEASSVSRAPRPSSLKGLSSKEAATRLARSPDTGERQRGLTRLGVLGSSAALDQLVELLDRGEAKSTRERLIIVRALSTHVDRESVRRSLLRVVTGGVDRSGGDELQPVVRTSAALALAASRGKAATEALGKALRQEGPAAVAAREALLAHPPRDLEPVVGTRGAPTQTLVRLLADLGDQRAFHPLRDIVRRGSPALRAEAALALTRLGHFETVPVARHWLKKKESDESRLASAQILVMARAPDAAKSIAALLDDDNLRAAGLELAAQSALPGLAPALLKRLSEAGPESRDERDELIALLAQTASTRAVRWLETRASRTGPDQLAALGALARCPGDAATQALDKLLGQEGSRSLAIRAAVIRRLTLGTRLPGLDEARQALAGSTRRGDQLVALWTTAALEPGLLTARIPELEADQLAVVAAPASRAVEPRLALAKRLETLPAGPAQVALSVVLTHTDAANKIPTKLLLSLLASPIARPLAARALAARMDKALEPRVRRLLSSPDPLVRGHALDGLGSSKFPSAVGLLANAYRFETDAALRLCIVNALSRQKPRARRRTLRLAARLDPDETTRSAARLALKGYRSGGSGSRRGQSTLLLNTQDSAGGPISTTLLIVSSPDRSLPLVSFADGAAVVTHLPSGAASVRLSEPTARK